MGFINQQTSLGGTILQGHTVMGTRFFGSFSEGEQSCSIENIENIEITYKQNKETEYVPPLRAPIESRCLLPLSWAMECQESLRCLELVHKTTAHWFSWKTVHFEGFFGVSDN